MEPSTQLSMLCNTEPRFVKLTDHLAGKTLNDWAFLSAVEAAKCVSQEMMLLAAAFHESLSRQGAFTNPFEFYKFIQNGQDEQDEQDEQDGCKYVIPEITTETPLKALCIGKYDPLKALCIGKYAPLLPFLENNIVDDVTDEFWLRYLLPEKFNTLASELYTCIVKNRV